MIRSKRIVLNGMGKKIKDLDDAPFMDYIIYDPYVPDAIEPSFSGGGSLEEGLAGSTQFEDREDSVGHGRYRDGDLQRRSEDYIADAPQDLRTQVRKRNLDQ